jgi:hypothetical protein
MLVLVVDENELQVTRGNTGSKYTSHFGPDTLETNCFARIRTLSRGPSVKNLPVIRLGPIDQKENIIRLVLEPAEQCSLRVLDPQRDRRSAWINPVTGSNYHYCLQGESSDGSKRKEASEQTERFC